MDRRADEQKAPFQALPRAFRLKRQRLIRPLFDRSRDDVGTLGRGSIRLLYRIVAREETGTDAPLQVGFSPGRIPTAVRRNRIKRVLREVYRTHQSDLVDLFCDRQDSLTLMVLRRGPDVDAEMRIREDLPDALKALTERLRKELGSLEDRDAGGTDRRP